MLKCHVEEEEEEEEAIEPGIATTTITAVGTDMEFTIAITALEYTITITALEYTVRSK